MSKKKKIIDIASEVEPEQFVKHSFHEELMLNFAVVCCASIGLKPLSVIDEDRQRKLIEKCMRTLNISSEVVSVGIIQGYINLAKKDFELSRSKCQVMFCRRILRRKFRKGWS